MGSWKQLALGYNYLTTTLRIKFPASEAEMVQEILSREVRVALACVPPLHSFIGLAEVSLFLAPCLAVLIGVVPSM